MPRISNKQTTTVTKSIYFSYDEIMKLLRAACPDIDQDAIIYVEYNERAEELEGVTFVWSNTTAEES